MLLGNVNGLDDRAVDMRFAAAMHRLATEKDEDPMANYGQVRKLYDIADTLLAVKGLPPVEADPPKMRKYTFSMCMEAEHSILARSFEEAKEKAREWIDGVRVIKMPEAETEDHIHMDEFSAQHPQLVSIEDT